LPSTCSCSVADDDNEAGGGGDDDDDNEAGGGGGDDDDDDDEEEEDDDDEERRTSLRCVEVAAEFAILLSLLADKAETSCARESKQPGWR
jgi:hypothetical protein